MDTFLGLKVRVVVLVKMTVFPLQPRTVRFKREFWVKESGIWSDDISVNTVIPVRKTFFPPSTAVRRNKNYTYRRKREDTRQTFKTE